MRPRIARKSREEVGQAFAAFKNFVEKQTGQQIKCVRSDNAAEYRGVQFAEIIKSSGIVHEFTVPGSPAQNGMAERMNLTLCNMVNCMLQDANLPKSLWAEALHTACYLRNRSATRVVEGVTPFEAFWRIKPNLQHLRTFGCHAIAIDKIIRRRKLDARGRRCILVGYSSHRKGYRVLDEETGKVFISRTVNFLSESVDDTNFVIDTKPTESSQQYPRRNPARSVKDVRPIPDLSAHNAKVRESERKKAEQQQLNQEQHMNEQIEGEQPPSTENINGNEEEDNLNEIEEEPPETIDQALNSKWRKFW